MAHRVKSPDRYWHGYLPGLVLPAALFFVFYFLRYSARWTLSEYWERIWVNGIFLPLVSLFVLVNLGVFFLYFQTYRHNAARGVIMATFFYALAVMVLKSM